MRQIRTPGKSGCSFKFFPSGAGSSLIAFVIVAVLAIVSGCGRSGVPCGFAHGTITVAGTPVTVGTVVFESTENGLAFMGAIQPDGTFRMRTHEADGIPAGTYGIAITPQLIATTDQNPPLNEELNSQLQSASKLIPRRYHRVDTSGLSTIVQTGENEPLVLELVR